MAVDLSVFERQKSVLDQQALQEAFNAKKRAMQLQELGAVAQIQKAMQPEQITPYQAATLALQEKALNQRLQPDPITPYQAANLELQRRRMDMAAGGTPMIDENGEIMMQPQRKLSATEQKDFSARQSELADLEKAAQAFEAIKSYQGKPMYSGFGADIRSSADTIPVIGRLVDDEKAANTRAYQNLVLEGQFSKLQSTFPGAISNAEREALQNLGALATFTPDQQTQILRNAQAAIERNKKIVSQRARDIATGEQYSKAAKPVVLSTDEITEADIAEYKKLRGIQ